MEAEFTDDEREDVVQVQNDIPFGLCLGVGVYFRRTYGINSYEIIVRWEVSYDRASAHRDPAMPCIHLH